MRNQPASGYRRFLQGWAAWLFAIANLSGCAAWAGEPNNANEENAGTAKTSPAEIGHEAYIGLFKGNAHAANSQVDATYPCLFCTPTSASANIQPDKGDIAGMRLGFWWEYFGYAMEFVSTHIGNTDSTNVPQMSVSYQSMSLIPMLRVPLLRTVSMPSGRFNLYGGFGVSFTLSGSIDVTIPPNPPISGNAKGTGGTVALIGAALRYPKSMFFLEWRATDIKLSSDNWAPADSATVPVNTNEMVVGAAYRF